MARMESDESNTKRVTVRVPKQLVEEYDDALDEAGKNRSQAIREHMRETVSQPATDGGLVPPQDDETLADAYRALLSLSDGSTIPLDEARSVLSSKLNVPKESISRRVLKPLDNRGYLRQTGDPINEPHIAVKRGDRSAD
ncbi:ribbon-helix-helix domain-containing protein [Halobacterium sp. KA-4]|uniref:ribbon-helix-helix domain-containing protein n=1 Tax=Halobacterium sp. KA-4 TaxID=2896367 RepID=UPI001E41F732|nr:ribbon-helix-helix domain-containing protein [Halobacterium sp. KA-4]MCD2199097.1 ribbon-helix-helix domain-containing protein [Halobacterium sp. KA-4]